MVQINVDPTCGSAAAVSSSVDRVQRENNTPSTGGVCSGILKVLAVIAMIGTILNLSFEVADTVRNDK